MKKFSIILTSILPFLILFISCEEDKVKGVDSPPTLATQLEEFEKDPSKAKADSLLISYQQMADTSEIPDAEIAEWYRKLAESLQKQEYWALSGEARIQSIRYDATGPNAPEHLIELAQQLHVRENRLPISKAAYKSIVDYYPASDQLAKAEENIAEDQPSLRNQIQDLENQLMQQTQDSLRLNKKAALDYITAVQLFAAMDSDDDEAPLLLNRAAAIAKGLGAHQQALDLYNWVLNDFSEKEAAKKALFYKGFTLDEELKNYEEAGKIYDQYLAKYPNDPMAQQVRILKEQLGKSNEEILEELQKKANQ